MVVCRQCGKELTNPYSTDICLDCSKENVKKIFNEHPEVKQAFKESIDELKNQRLGKEWLTIQLDLCRQYRIYRKKEMITMFNSYNPVQRVNVNSVSGTLSKTCKDSYFQCCQIGSTKFDNIVNGKMVVILQVMIMSDKYVMFEVITKADFEKLNDN